jgi:hypothetical protein
MPTRKQRRRQAKEKRHEYEFVYVDSEGHELEEPPDGAEAEPKKADERRNGSSPAAQPKGKQQQKGGRAGRVPQPPSWQRAAKRAGLLGIVVFILFSFSASRSHSGWASALLPAVIYTALFVPFTYMIDRYAYRRYLAKQGSGATGPTGKKPPAKKR